MKNKENNVQHVNIGLVIVNQITGLIEWSIWIIIKANAIIKGLGMEMKNILQILVIIGKDGWC